MTLKQLAKRLDIIMAQLRPLGLGHWIIDLAIVDEIENAHMAAGLGVNAACTTSVHYDKMWLEFNQEFIDDSTEEEIDRVIIHELIHAAMRDFDHAIHGVNEYLGEPHKSAWQSEVNHAREGIVERLAQSINLILRSNLVQST